MGEIVPEVLSTARGRYSDRVSHNTDRPRPVNNIFIFSNRDLKVSGKFSFTLQFMCVEVGRVRVDEARDRLQTKKHYNMIFSWIDNLCYGMKGFCVLLYNS